MKLIVVGSSGYVATEIIRQALSHSAITNVLAVGRREISAPGDLGANADPSKLKSVVMKDYGVYTEDLKSHLGGADAVIWTVAITPSKSKLHAWEEVCKICRDCPIQSIETIAPLPREGKTKPLRFTYMSGISAQRDPTKKPFFYGEYCLMRGQAESSILKYAQESNGLVEACMVKPGLIDNEKTAAMFTPMRAAIAAAANIPRIPLHIIATAMINQSVNGFEKDTLEHADLLRIGTKALAERNDKESVHEME